MKTKTIIIAAAAGLVTTLGAAGMASAGGKSSHNSMSMKKESHESHEHHRPHFNYIIAPSYSCGYYYDKWQYTGSFYWKKQYFICKGW